MSRSALGSISSNADGTVHRVRVPGGYGMDGKRIRASVTVRGTRREAEIVKARLIDELTGKSTLAEIVGPLSIRELGEEWLHEVEPDIRQRTLDGYRSILKLYITPELGAIRVDRLSPVRVASFITAMKRRDAAYKRDGETRKLSPRTVLSIYRVLHELLQYAVVSRRIDLNPCDAIVKPKAAKTRPQALTLDEASALVNAVEGHVIEPVILACLGAGLRRSEACALEWSDFHLWRRKVKGAETYGGTVTVRRGMHQRGGNVWYEPPKTVESGATLPLPGWCALRLYRLRAFGAIVPDGGGAMKPDKVARLYRKLAEGHHLRDLPMKNLRHTYATLLLAAAVDVRTVQQMMRHTTVTTTETFYTDPGQSFSDGAAAAYDRLMRVPTRPKRPNRAHK